MQISGPGSIDFDASKIAVSYKNARIAVADVYTDSTQQFDSNPPSDLKTYISNMNVSCMVVVVQGDDDEMLEAGEVFAVCLNLEKIDSTNGPLAEYEQFTVEIAPPVGAKLTYTGRMPPTLEGVMLLSGS